MSSPTRKMATTEGAFRSRDSKRLNNKEAIAPKQSFHNLRQLFKLPARVLTPLSSNHENRGRAPMVNQAEPRTHRLMRPISPTRGLPSNSNTLPNLRVLTSRNASNSLLPSPGRNISEPLPLPRFPQPDYSRAPSGLRSTYTMNQCAPAPRTTSQYELAAEAEFEARSISSVRRTLADITRRINSPQLRFPRLSLGPRNVSTPMITVPYTSGPTTSASQQISPPRPVFTNGKRPVHRAERSLSMLNEENRRSTYGSGRPRSITTRDNLATTHHFTDTVSSLIRASETTTTTTNPTTPPKAVFTTNPRCVYTSQPHAYWAGRFMALHDQYHSQMLYATLNDQKLFQAFIRPSKDTPKLFKTEVNHTLTNSDVINSSRCSSPATCNQAIYNDEVRRCKQVFYTLQSLCVTVEAKKSLWGFQLRFARERRMETCLPDGGTMEPDKGLRPWTRVANMARSNTVDSGLGETF
jgi:hypothetical protein